MKLYAAPLIPLIAGPFLPPAQYDHAYAGDLIIARTSVESIHKLCPSSKVPIGCSFPRPDIHRCFIFMVPDDVIRKAGYDPKVVLRHETGHCNGWPANHPNAR